MNLYRQQIPYYISVAMGREPGVQNVGKFGYNPTIASNTDPEDLWEGGGLYNFSDDGVADIVSLASDNAGDVGQSIQVEGLGADGTFVSQIVTTNGTTRVALETPLWRCYRMGNMSNIDAMGTIFVYTGTGSTPSIGDPEVRAVIQNGNNQTQMTIYSVPKGKVAAIVQGEIVIEYEEGGFFSSAAAARCSFRVRTLGSVTRIAKTVSLISNGSSIYQIDVVPGMIPALSDFWIRVDDVTDTMGISGTFEVLLFDEEMFSEEKLQSIGQPGY